MHAMYPLLIVFFFSYEIYTNVWILTVDDSFQRSTDTVYMYSMTICIYGSIKFIYACKLFLVVNFLTLGKDVES